MRREFASNLVLLLAINVLVKPLYLFGVEIGVQNTVGAANYGRYGTWLAFAFLFGVVYDLGLQNYNAVTLSKQPELLRERLPIMLSLKLLLSLVFAAVVVLAAWVYGVASEDWTLVWLAVGYLVVLSMLQLLRTNVAAQGKYRLNSFISILDKLVLTLVLGAVLLLPAWRAQLTVEWFFGAQIAALLVACLVALGSTTLQRGQRWLHWDSPAVWSLLRSTLPYGLVLLLSTALTRVDVLMIERLSPLGTYEAGKYLGAYRILDGINMVGFMFASLLIPMLSKQVASGLSAKQLLQQASGYIAALGVGVAAWTSFHASAIVETLYLEADASWGQTLAWLMWAAVSVGFAYVYGSYLLARQSTRWINGLFVLALAANVLLNYLLIPRYGAVGAAMATVGTQGFVAAGEYVRSSQLERAWGIGERWWSLVAYAAGVLAVAYATAAAGWSVGWSLVVQVAACAVAGILTGLLVDPRSLITRLRGRSGD